MALASIAQEVQALSKKLGLSTDLSIIEYAWDRELGNLREFAKIVALHRGSLMVEVNSSVVMQEISLRRRELVRRLNKHLPVPSIEEIRVRVAHEWVS